MKATTITATDFLSGRYMQPESVSRHPYRATMIERRIVVTDAQGNHVKVNFAGTIDNRSYYAYVEGGEGFIGGWQYPHKAMPWRHMVESINRGILYPRMEMLPKRFRREGAV